MKAHAGLWRVLCWTSVILLVNGALTACFSIEPKVEDEVAPADTAAARAVVDSVPMPIFKEDSLATPAPLDSTDFEVPAGLTFSDSVLADTLYAKKKEEQPIYKKWWFLALVGGVLAATIIAVASGDDGEGRQNLPEFPDPPEK